MSKTLNCYGRTSTDAYRLNKIIMFDETDKNNIAYHILLICLMFNMFLP